MGLMYSAAFEQQAEAGAVDFFEITAAADASIIVHEIHIGQDTEEGDTQAELLPWSIVRGEGATSGSGGNTTTITALQAGASASGATVEDTNTTKMVAGGGSITTIHNDAFHVAAGLHYVPTPQARPVISAGDKLTVELVVAPADSITWSGTVIFEEIGG